MLGLAKPSQLALADGLDEDRYDELVARRADRVPLQHLVGTAVFRWVELQVGPGVFVPRPETESVVQWVLDRRLETPLIVDLCTGSGAIALSLADEIPGATVHAVEKDSLALTWAARNVEGTRVSLHEGSAATALPDLDGTVDVVISNPPYLPDGERGLMAPEALKDPSTALFGGADGLDVIREVEQTAKRLLKPGGWVVVEHADTQGSSAPAVFTEWDEVQDHQDLTGRDRFVTARKREQR
ncbi:MAG: hemK [Frankiales bacterium]|nr:hemK [Frankiales bacterium]